MSFHPSGDGMVVEDPDMGETTESGLVVPESAQKLNIYGTIIKVGPGRRNEAGDRVEMDYWVGQKVMYHRHCGRRLDVDGEELHVIVPADIAGWDDDE